VAGVLNLDLEWWGGYENKYRTARSAMDESLNAPTLSGPPPSAAGYSASLAEYVGGMATNIFKIVYLALVTCAMALFLPIKLLTCGAAIICGSGRTKTYTSILITGA
jgi:hypothetical protein